MRFEKLMVSLSSFATILATTALFAQQPATPTESGLKNWTTTQDHQNMMMQLGIRKLRPGPNADENAPNPANYDESLANPFPNLPEVLILKNGEKVTTEKMWWKKRRPEIIEDFEREVLGRIPPNVPQVTWEVIETTQAKVGAYPVVGKQLVGHVDHSACPAIEVDIKMILVTPANAKGPVPLMMMFDFGLATLPGAPPSAAAKKWGFGPPPAGSDPPPTEQLLAAGWGYAYLNAYSLQADNGAGLTRGIIGLANKGKPRKPDDWGDPCAHGRGALPEVWITWRPTRRSMPNALGSKVFPALARRLLLPWRLTHGSR
jgi:hypothetical protein